MRDGAEGLPLDRRLFQLWKQCTELSRVLRGDDEVIVEETDHVYISIDAGQYLLCLQEGYPMRLGFLPALMPV